MTIPTFGQKIENQAYQVRFGVYAIICKEEEGRILLVQAPNGAWFLPGGEIEKAEDQEAALQRELAEECGLAYEEISYLGQADEYFYSSHRETYYHNPAYIYQVHSYTSIGAPLEDFNRLAWFPIEEALDKLKRGSHQWGLKEWKDKNI